MKTKVTNLTECDDIIALRFHMLKDPNMVNRALKGATDFDGSGLRT